MSFQEEQHLIQRLKKDHREVKMPHLGAKSTLSSTKSKRLSSIAKHGISSKSTTESLINMARFTESDQILELGTSLGINAARLKKSSTASSITTIEGNHDIASIAQENFDNLDVEINLIVSGIDDALEKIKSEGQLYDLIFLDANHTYDATLRYFFQCLMLSHEKTILVFDDINWSQEMMKAWKEIKKSSQVSMTIENYQLGIVFLDQNITSDNYVLDF